MHSLLALLDVPEHSGPNQSISVHPQSHVRRRLLIATEILETEETYVRSLELLYTHFLAPLRQSLQNEPTRPLLAKKYLNDIFSNLEDILNVNRELLLQLRVRLRGAASVEESPLAGKPTLSWDPMRDKLGDIFMSLTPFLKVYSVYVKNFKNSLRVVSVEQAGHARFAAFVKVRCLLVCH
jgi:hypothetical protein